MFSSNALEHLTNHNTILPVHKIGTAWRNGGWKEDIEDRFHSVINNNFNLLIQQHPTSSIPREPHNPQVPLELCTAHVGRSHAPSFYQGDCFCAAFSHCHGVTK